MFNKILFVSLIMAGVAVQARDKFDGCGLGWEVTAEKTMIATTTRGTTNYFVPPAFGMTSGTIGCDQFEGFAANERKDLEFVAQNFEVLRSELALGQGEYVQGAAKSFGCDSASFGAHIQQNFNSIVAPAQNGVELYKNLKVAASHICS